MQLSIYHITNYFKTTLEKIKSKINFYTNDKRIGNYILYGNCVFIVAFGTMIFLLRQEKVGNYLDIREAISRIKEVSEGYELELIKAQVTLKPNIEKISSIITDEKKERKNIAKISENIDNKSYLKKINTYLVLLDKRLLTRDALINHYKSLAKIYKDYFVIADNAEKIIADDIKLHLNIKHIMLSLERIRLVGIGKNRNAILKAIYQLRNKLIYTEPVMQEKVGLFADTTEEIVKSLRHIDTIKNSMHSDGHDTQLKYLKSLTADEINYEELKFSSKLILFLFMSIILVTAQFIILTVFFINKKRTEKLEKEASDTINKSKEIAERAKIYALDAQRSQYKLLYNFCSDFDTIISTVSHSSDTLKENSEKENLFDCDASFFDKQKTSITTLNASIIALERWLNNYLEVYTPQNNWKEMSDDVINVTDLFDKHFAETRFFLRERQHFLSIFHGDIPYDIISDKEYLLKLFINMIYISVKWASDSWLKSSISIKENDTINTTDADKKYILNISVVNGASYEKYLEGAELFSRESISLQDNTNDSDKNDRFIVASLYYLRQICDILQANISFERNTLEENILTIAVPIKTSLTEKQSIGVPILKNKNILVISPYNPILSTMEKQLTDFGLNVTAIHDKYSAIGHIVGRNNAEQKYDLFIIDHNPPDIDAESLTQIIRENSQKNLAHIVVITTEDYLPNIEQHRSLYDGSFVKPVMPQLLKSKLEELVEIQLYGIQNDTNEMYQSEDKEKICRFLAIMDQDLSSMLLQLILTKSHYHVDVVSSSAQIFEMIEINYYDFILVSNKLNTVIPENLVRDIRRHHSSNKDSVFIMIYDILKDSVYKKLVRFGFDDFIPLPLSRTVFIEKIEKWAEPITQRMNVSGINLTYDHEESVLSKENIDALDGIENNDNDIPKAVDKG
jgi:PleD family two-component response regulator